MRILFTQTLKSYYLVVCGLKTVYQFLWMSVSSSVKDEIELGRDANSRAKPAKTLCFQAPCISSL